MAKSRLGVSDTVRVKNDENSLWWATFGFVAGFTSCLGVLFLLVLALMVFSDGK